MVYFSHIPGIHVAYTVQDRQASVDMDIFMDIHVKYVAIYMDMDVKFHIHGNPGDICRKLQLFPTPLHLTPAFGCSHWNSGKMLIGSQKTRIMGYQAVKTV